MSTQLLNGQARSEPGAAQAPDRQPTGGMDDSEVTAAFAAGDPAGLAAAYDRYAAALYGYCRWMLPGSRQAADALLDTFAAAEATLGELRDAGQMRAWLYAAARDACLSRKPSPDAGFDEIAGEVGQLAADKRTELRRLIRATLAEFDPLEHEVIELTIRHNLDETELATVLEVSWNRAHTLASRAREHLEKALAALLIAHVGRQSCPELGAQLADWDGRLTVETGKLTARHIERCKTCTRRRPGALRPEALAELLPLAALPGELREPILQRAAVGADPAAHSDAAAHPDVQAGGPEAESYPDPAVRRDAESYLDTKPLPAAEPEPGSASRRALGLAGFAAGQDRSAPSSLSPEVHSVARGTMVNIAAMVVGAGLSFALTVLVSHWLQPRNAGALFELIALYTIVSTTLQLGGDVGLTRWISAARAVGGLGLVRRVVAIVVMPVLAVGFLTSTIVWVTAPAIARIFLHGMVPAVAAADVRIIGVLVPLGALSACIVAGARGYGRMWPYLAVEGLGKPIARMCLVLVALVLGLGLQGALIAWGVPVIFGLAAAWLILAHFIRTESPGGGHRLSPLRQSGRLWRPPARQLIAPHWPAASARRPGRERGRHQRLSSQAAGQRTGLAMDFWRFAGPRGFAGAFQIVVFWLDILLVGAMVSPYAAGIYGAVSKLAVVGSFALEGTRLAIGPELSGLLARKEHARTADLYQTATRWLMAVSWPVYLLFAIFPAVVLGIFGHRYAAGAASLVVLSLAMLVCLGTGNQTVVLLMGGKSSWNLVNAFAALAVNVGLNLVLLPRIGILGAAIAWAASIVLDNVAAVIEIWVLLHLSPFGPGYGLVVAATVGCFGITGLAARAILGETLPALVVAIVLGGAIFVVVAYLARARLQLAELVAALLQRRPAAGTGEHGPQPSNRG